MKCGMKKSRFNLTMNPQLHAAAAEAARERGVSLSAWVSFLISAELQKASRLELRAERTSPAKGKETAMRASRNAPCPCGSGKKFKRCCGA